MSKRHSPLSFSTLFLSYTIFWERTSLVTIPKQQHVPAGTIDLSNLIKSVYRGTYRFNVWCGDYKIANSPETRKYFLCWTITSVFACAVLQCLWRRIGIVWFELGCSNIDFLRRARRSVRRPSVAGIVDSLSLRLFIGWKSRHPQHTLQVRVGAALFVHSKSIILLQRME